MSVYHAWLSNIRALVRILLLVFKEHMLAEFVSAHSEEELNEK